MELMELATPLKGLDFAVIGRLFANGHLKALLTK